MELAQENVGLFLGACRRTILWCSLPDLPRCLACHARQITPAHDPNDYECGKRHGLPFITILTPDGAMNEEAAQFAGMMRCVARAFSCRHSFSPSSPVPRCALLFSP